MANKSWLSLHQFGSPASIQCRTPLRVLEFAFAIKMEFIVMEPFDMPSISGSTSRKECFESI